MPSSSSTRSSPWSVPHPQQGARRASRLLAATAALAALLGLAACEKKDAAPPAAPAKVGVHVVAPQRQDIVAELPGRTSASLVAEIRPQVGGIVQKRLFEEGAMVKAGQVLYQIDPASFEADAASAQAAVAKAEATLGAARITAQRNAELARIQAISQQLSDDSQAALKQAEADLGVARATLQSRRIDLSRTRITAPISGRSDISTVTPGALVTASQTTAMTTVQQIDPMLVDVVQSTSDLLTLRNELASGKFRSAGADEAPLKLVLEDGSIYPIEARLKFSGMTVDRSTGAVTLRATVPNPQGKLLPGMYVRAQLQTAVAEAALLVPQQGIVRTPTGDASAMVVGAGDKVERRSVTIDRAIGNRWLITAGLKAGDRVIVEGLQRAKVGAVVQPEPVRLAEAGTELAAPTAPGSAPAAVGTSSGTAGGATASPR